MAVAAVWGVAGEQRKAAGCSPSRDLSMGSGVAEVHTVLQNMFPVDDWLNRSIELILGLDVS